MSIQYDIPENSNLAECRRATQPQSQTETKQWEMGDAKDLPLCIYHFQKTLPQRDFNQLVADGRLKQKKDNRAKKKLKRALKKIE